MYSYIKFSIHSLYAVNYSTKSINISIANYLCTVTVNQQILAAIKFGVSPNKVIVLITDFISVFGYIRFTQDSDSDNRIEFD